MAKQKIKNLILVLFLLSLNVALASDAKPVNISTLEDNSVHLINRWESIPFKDIRPLDKNYINNWVNPNHNLDWNANAKYPDKCLSYSAATMNDWFSIQSGKPFRTYQNFMNNRSENGTNPRFLEEIYFTHSKGAWKDDYYDFAWKDDLITGEPMPYDIKGYADILTGNYPLWINKPDTLLGSDYPINVVPYMFNKFSGFEAESDFGGHLFLSPDYEQIKYLINHYGIVYAQLESSLMLGQPVHAVTLIGYGNFDCDGNGTSEDIFWIHDTYDEEYNGTNSNVRYKCVNANDISEVLALYDPTWSMYQHDLRRTGLTTLKGSIDDTDIRAYTVDFDLLFDYSPGIFFSDKPAIGDADNDGKMEIVVGSSMYGLDTASRVYMLECNDCDSKNPKFESKWIVGIDDDYVHTTPVITDFEGDRSREVVINFGSRIASLKGATGAESSPAYYIETKGGAELPGEVNHIAVADIDLDGIKDVVFADFGGAGFWDSELYVLDNNLDETYSISLGDNVSGPEGAIGVANLNHAASGTDYPEIVVPERHGIKIYKIENNDLTLVSHFDVHGIYSTPVLADIDMDNKYEIIFSNMNNLRSVEL